MHPDLSHGTPSAGLRFRTFPWLWLLPAYLAACVVARCIILSGKQLLVLDELLTWYPVSASFHSMLWSTTDTINTSPPLYFVVAWLWAIPFGHSAISLRLLSALILAGAMLAMFKVLKRVYGPLAASAALTVAIFDPALLYQSMSARFYTLMLAEVALGILVYQRMMMQRRPSFGLLAANAAIHASLVMTHYFGLIYSGVILGGVLLTCFFRQRSPLYAGLSIVAGWLVFLPWIPAFLRHFQMGRPAFWIPVPKFANLKHYFGHFLTDEFSVLAAILFGLAIAAVVFAVAYGPRHQTTLPRLFAVRRREIPLLVLAPLFGLVPVTIYFISTRPGGMSSFLYRYMLPSAFGWAIVCACISNRVFRMRSLLTRRDVARALAGVQAAAIILFVGCCGWNLLEAARVEKVEKLSYGLSAALPLTEPIVIEHIHDFMRLHFYSPEPQRYLFLIDPEAGIKAGGGGLANHQTMAALKRHFPDQFEEVMPSEVFLARATSFWIKTSPWGWWQFRVLHNPAFVTDFMIPKLGLVHVRRRQ